ncbi:uDENN domain [Dillenia turbinata]|uniref:UDENN domain n=1 Tax=Dillenia turbinata TaxID=194707 RepID=A0AAN8ZEF5_9MAGN
MQGEKVIKEDDGIDDMPSSPYRVLQQLSEGAIRVAGEALHTVYTGSSGLAPPELGHRRSQSEVSVAGLAHRRSNSFQRFRSHIERAWKWGGNSKNLERQSSFNLEVLANQKRQWYQSHSKIREQKEYKEPTSLFEHFVIVGLHSDTNLAGVEDAFATRKKWELEMAKTDIIDLKLLKNRGPSLPVLEPKVIFKYPPQKRLALRPKDLAAFCFSGGVKAQVLERTPSLSDLNELVYGQEHLGRDDSSFIFSLKVADNATLYGVCLHVQEIVQRPPGIFGVSSPLSKSSGGSSRFLVSAPRCYCVLTRVPFFELHYEMLNSIIAEERLNRIQQFVSEMTLTDYDVSISKLQQQISESVDSPNGGDLNDWMASAIPLDSAMALTAAAAGIISDDEIPSSSSRAWEPPSPESFSASEASDFTQVREDGGRDVHYFDDNVSEFGESPHDNVERISGCCENGHISPHGGTDGSISGCILERLASSDSLFSSARSMGSEDEDDELWSNCKHDIGDNIVMEWAKENKNDLLQIICAYHSLPVPSHGSEIVFQPLEHLQAIEYRRPSISALGLVGKYLDFKLGLAVGAAEINAELAAAEEALALAIWTTATICRALSLESILALFTGVLLEKQVVVVCPNLGILSAIVLSVIPIIRPFQWQSLLLPVLPRNMLDFLDAPVPYIVGIQHKPADLKMKTTNLVHVNVLKDQVKMCHLPSLPRRKELASKLGSIHARLSCEKSIAKRHPIYRCNEVQAEAAAQFLMVMRHYMESLCSDLRSYTITSVEPNNDRVSLLLKDSFIDSFQSRDQPFIKIHSYLLFFQTRVCQNTSMKVPEIKISSVNNIGAQHQGKKLSSSFVSISLQPSVSAMKTCRFEQRQKPNLGENSGCHIHRLQPGCFDKMKLLIHVSKKMIKRRDYIPAQELAFYGLQ